MMLKLWWGSGVTGFGLWMSGICEGFLFKEKLSAWNLEIE
jgi:hypothetical protein